MVCVNITRVVLAIRRVHRSTAGETSLLPSGGRRRRKEMMLVISRCYSKVRRVSIELIKIIQYQWHLKHKLETQRQQS